MKNLLILLLTALSTFVAVGQVSISLKVDRRQYLKYEPVTAIVTITNRSGRELDFTSKLEGTIAHSWLDFSMRDSGGRAMQKRHNKVFQRAVIPAGRSMSRRVNLSGMFGVAKVGNFAVTAHVRRPGVEEYHKQPIRHDPHFHHPTTWTKHGPQTNAVSYPQIQASIQVSEQHANLEPLKLFQ